MGGKALHRLGVLVLLGLLALSGCTRPVVAEQPVARGPGLPPSILVSPFTPWADEAPVDEAALLASGEHARGRVGGVKVQAVRKLEPPRLEQARTAHDGHLELEFGRDVCPSGEKVDDVLTFDPPVEGKARWTLSNRLEFEPAEAWPPATRIVATLGARLCSTASLSKAQRIEVVHRPLRYVSISADRPLGPDTTIAVRFSDPVRLEDVDKTLTVEHLGANQQTIGSLPIRVTAVTDEMRRSKKKGTDGPDGVAESFVIEPTSPWPRDALLRVTVPGEMRGLGGLPILAPRTTSFRTWGAQRITPACPTYVRHQDCKRGVADARGLDVHFRNPLKTRVVHGLKVSPRPKNLRWSLADPKRLVITGDFALGERYEVTVPAGLRDAFAQRTTRPTTLSYVIGEPQPLLDLQLGPKGTEDWGDTEPAILRADRAVVGVVTRRVKSVQLRIAAVPDARLPDFLGDEADRMGTSLPWLVDETITLKTKGPTQWSSLGIDLADELGKRRGAFLVTVRPVELADPEGPAPDPRTLLVQVGDLGVTLGQSAHHGHELRVASLRDGRPVSGAAVRVVIVNEAGDEPKSRSIDLGKTDAAGHLHVAPPAALAEEETAVLVVADPKGDQAVLGAPGWGLDGREPDALLAPNESLLGHVITERGLYRPGETVHVVGWGKIGSPEMASGQRALPRGTTLKVKLEAEEVVQTKSVVVGPQGKLTASLDIPAEAKVGGYTVKVFHGPTSESLGTARIKVEHYRVPAFFVDVEAKDQPDLGHARFEARASHYSGEPVSIVGATVAPSCYSSRPDRRDFGVEQGWELGWTSSRSSEPEAEHVTITASTPSTDAPAEKVDIELDASKLPIGRSEICGVTADLLSRTLQSQSNARTPRRRLYGVTETIGLRLTHPRKHDGARRLALRAVAHTGDEETMKRVAWPEPVTVTLSSDELDAPIEICTVRINRFADARCRIGPLKTQWGNYRLEVRDSRGLLAATTFWASRTAPTPQRLERSEPKELKRCATYAGRKQCHETRPNEDFSKAQRGKDAELTIVPEMHDVLVGERARVAVVGPYHEAPGLLLVRTAGVAEHVPFVMKRGRAELTVDVKPSWEGGVELNAWVTPPVARRPGKDDPKTEQHHSASVHLEVTDRERALDVAIEAPAKARIREQHQIAVRVTDEGKPVKARVSLWVTDSAVLQLSGYSLPSLYDLVTHPALHGMDVLERYAALRLPFVPKDSDEIYFAHGAGTGSGQGFGSGHGGLGGSHRSRPPRLRMGATNVLERADFRTTPLFVGDIETDADGRAVATLKLPDNLTEFSVLAVASAALEDPSSSQPEIAERFGTKRSTIQVTKPVVVTAALPRHLRPGDEARIAAVVRNNQTDPIEVEVSAAVEGVTATSGEPVLTLRGKPQRATLGPGQDARLSFQLSAVAVGNGTVRLKADVIGDPAASDAVRLGLDVAEERLRYLEDGMQGVIEGVAEPDEHAVTVPVQLVKGIDASKVEARLSLGRSPVTGLESAAASLMRFPYGCVEQLSSKLVPIIAVKELRDMGVVDQNPDVFVRTTIRKILDHQRDDGAFGLWSSKGDAHAYGSAYATWVLVQAAEAGYAVPKKALERALAFAERMQEMSSDPKDEDYVSSSAKRLALWAVALHGASTPWVKGHVDEALTERLPEGAFELAILSLTFAAAIPDGDPGSHARLRNALKAMLLVRGDQAGVAGPALSYGAPMGALVPGSAAILMALIALEPDNPVVHKLAKGLLALRRGGHWAATQDNAYALVALARYAKLVGAPQTVGTKGWVATTPALTATLDDEGPNASSDWLPLVSSTEASAPSVTVQRLGAGPVHYQLRVRRMRPAGERPPDRVLSVTRRLRTNEGPVEGEVVAGQILALDIELSSPDPVSYVAIDVPLPAGLEPVIVGLRGKIDSMLGDTQRARSDQVVHQEALPDRVVLFMDRVRPGRHEHTVYVRAVTPGTYDFPAARAMAQYAPAVRGWSSAGRFTVK